MPAYSYMKFLWDTLQDEAAPALAAIRLPPPLDLIALRLAGNFRHATLAPLPDVPDAGQGGNRIVASWMGKERRLFLTRISILAFLAFLSDLPPPAHPEPAGPTWQGQPEDTWIARTLRAYDCAVQGKWQRVNAQVHLRSLSSFQKVKASYSQKDCLWKLHIFSERRGSPTLTQPAWLTRYNTGLYSTADATIEYAEEALLLHSLTRARPQDHLDAVWVARASQQGTWVLAEGA